MFKDDIIEMRFDDDKFKTEHKDYINITESIQNKMIVYLGLRSIKHYKCFEVIH